jgi:hypothetical protein
MLEKLECPFSALTPAPARMKMRLTGETAGMDEGDVRTLEQQRRMTTFSFWQAIVKFLPFPA